MSMSGNRIRHSFGDRFRAWWEGYYLDEVEDDFASTEPTLSGDSAEIYTEKTVAEVDDRSKIWSRWRVEAAEQIWGHDFLGPGGAEFIVYLAKPMALTPSVSLLDLSAKLGGGARAIANAFGCWVTGLEPDSDLAEEGGLRSKKEDMDKKAPIRDYLPDQVELKPKSFECVFADDLFYQLADKERLLSAVHKGLKAKGQLLFTDLLVDGDGTSEALQKWVSRTEPRPHLWSVARMQATLETIGFDVRIAEDYTATYRGQILRAFARLVDNLQNRSIPKHLRPRVFEEAELWALRMEAIDKGGLRAYRFHAFKYD
jgi:SAM-dependent methyltransferase